MPGANPLEVLANVYDGMLPVEHATSATNLPELPSVGGTESCLLLLRHAKASRDSSSSADAPPASGGGGTGEGPLALWDPSGGSVADSLSSASAAVAVAASSWWSWAVGADDGTPQSRTRAVQRAEGSSSSSKSPPVIIAQSLLGDHRGYGRLWNMGLHHSDLYALRHRGLGGGGAFMLDQQGRATMVGEYAMALVSAFARSALDLVGASFGAVLASHIARAVGAAGGLSRRLILIDPPPAIPRELPVPKMLTSLRTAAMGVLLICLRIEMGASVLEQFHQLQTLPEDALSCFVAAQCLPDGLSKADLAAGAERYHRMMLVYRQCRHAFHSLSASIEAHEDDSGRPAVLIALSSERWPTFREMFPGIKEDVVTGYGQAATLTLPGKHIAMIHRCLSNRDATFTGALDRFLSDSFDDAWWWVEHVPAPPMQAAHARQPRQPTDASRAEVLMPLLSALVAPSTSRLECEASGASATEVTAVIQHVSQELLGSQPSADAPLMEAGLDSLGAVEFRGRLMTRLGNVVLPETLIFDFPTMRQIHTHVLGVRRGPTTARGSNAVAPAGTPALLQLLSRFSPLAASAPPGVARVVRHVTDQVVEVRAANAKLSGGVSTLDLAWGASARSHDAVGAVPHGRWDALDSTKTHVTYGAFMLAIQLFDHKFFGIAPAEAVVMDPHQWLALEGGYSALCDAGLDRGALMGSATGVFAGIWQSDYKPQVAAGLGPFVLAGMGCSMLVGRVSYVLGLHGPSVPFDTACSSSLTAAHAASYALYERDTDAGLVLGVNMMCEGSTSVLFASAGMTSAVGKSFTFDSRADGYARGEAGCCAVLQLVPATSRSVRYEAGAVCHDGKSASLTAPNGSAQQALLRAAFERAGRSEVGSFLLEAHGTGTSLGDPIEARAMHAVLNEQQQMAVMGCKANFAHPEPAAGLSGLLRLSMALRCASVAPNAQLRAMNPHMKSTMRAANPTSFPAQLELSQAVEGARVGGVSSFGLSGTIAHAVLASSGAEQRGERNSLARPPPAYLRRAFAWRSVAHPFAQRLLLSSDGDSVLRSPALGAFVRLVAHHQMNGQVVFPAAGYLEMVNGSRAAVASPAKSRAEALLKSVVFMQPLFLGEGDGHIDCILRSDGTFLVQAAHAAAHAEPDGMDPHAMTTHCSGSQGMPQAQSVADAASPRSSHVHSAHVAALYDTFYDAGLQLGPSFRQLGRVWECGHDAAECFASLRPRTHSEGTHVHPADVDAAALLYAASSTASVGAQPFALDEAMLSANYCRQQWASNRRQATGGTIDLSLFSASRPVARLSGFKSRSAKAAAKSASEGKRWKYAIEWARDPHTDMNGAASQMDVLVVGCSLERLRASPPARAAATVNHARSVVGRRRVTLHAAALVLDRATDLSVVEGALSMLQEQASRQQDMLVWLCTSGTQPPYSSSTRCSHAGLWGLARSYRAEYPDVTACCCADVYEPHSLATLAKAAQMEQIRLPNGHVWGLQVSASVEPEVAFVASVTHVPRLVMPYNTDMAGSALSFSSLREDLALHTSQAQAALEMEQLQHAYSLLEALCQQYARDAVSSLLEAAVPVWHHKLLYAWCAKQLPSQSEHTVLPKGVRAAHADMWAETQLIERSGPQFADALSGAVRYQELLFPGGSMEAVLPVYEQTAVSVFFNGCVVAAIETIIALLRRSVAAPHTPRPTPHTPYTTTYTLHIPHPTRVSLVIAARQSWASTAR